mmetsp:Transcript_16604/g.32764  ORF Transcript_16604/g.32764 Transcript_16604/m.32764 type:complete len:114 (-) Transcript_16604:402-743(-)
MNSHCISENPIQSRSRHIDYRVMSLRERVEDKTVVVLDCTTHDMVADNMTKNLPFPAFSRHRATQLGNPQWVSGSFYTFSGALYRPSCPVVFISGADLPPPDPRSRGGVENVS